MAAAAPSPLASSVEKTNGAKLSRLLTDGGTTVRSLLSLAPFVFSTELAKGEGAAAAILNQSTLQYLCMI